MRQLLTIFLAHTTNCYKHNLLSMETSSYATNMLMVILKSCFKRANMTFQYANMACHCLLFIYNYLTRVMNVLHVLTNATYFKVQGKKYI